VIFVHAVEVDHGLASHFVGPDPLEGDQLISLSLSEFAIAATVIEFDELAPLVVITVNHVSTGIYRSTAFGVPDEAPADLFDAICA
jgi:hypothetical protein